MKLSKSQTELLNKVKNSTGNGYSKLITESISMSILIKRGLVKENIVEFKDRGFSNTYYQAVEEKSLQDCFEYKLVTDKNGRQYSVKKEDYVSLMVKLQKRNLL